MDCSPFMIIDTVTLLIIKVKKSNEALTQLPSSQMAEQRLKRTINGDLLTKKGMRYMR